MKREYVYQAFERFWHWAQAALITLLGVTGFEIHGSLKFFGFRQAVEIHNFAAITFLILISFAIFWHLTSGVWRQYVPTTGNVKAQIDYYITGIFRGAPHPTKKTVLSKLNPLQKLVYAGLKVLVIPIVVTSGLIYMFYRYPQQYEIISLNIKGLSVVAVIHTFGAFLLAAFFVMHVYLTTTGSTPTANLKAMVTGFEDLPDEDHETPHTARNERKPELVN
ncbi:MAG: cytochrome b/b6 domain-containing protein [Calditrichaeota bacterium]|nr:cytochrome b/b6 domain-containing protein [Calditrichota bacterium]MCB9367095.1 cytochrome b/b6 domain-containing protein [Calditrichota bacterium]